MSFQKSEHIVYIYKGDYNAMCTEVYKHQNFETGGNLFGLWTTSGSCVIHVVLGPGKGCRRTDTSFHQDIKYMKRVGSFINEGYMLCHIGEWHSHHRLKLSKPSHGDEQTIEHNFPRGMDKFLVIIANIVNRDTIQLSPYFFIDGGKRYEKAEIKVLENDSPFSSDPTIAAEIEKGAETIFYKRNETALVDLTNHRVASLNESGPTIPTHSPANQHSLGSQANSNTSGNQGNQISSHSNTTGDRGEPMDTTDDDLLHPPRDYDKASASAGVTTSSTNTLITLSTAQVGNDPPSYSDAVRGRDHDESKPSKREILLKTIHDELKKWFGDKPESEFEFEKSKQSSRDIEIRFKHRQKFWMIRFPDDFPASPAKLFCSYLLEKLHLVERSYDTVKPLNNAANILLSIKENCSLSCNLCERLTKESLTKSDFIPSCSEEFSAAVNRLMNEIISALGLEEIKLIPVDDRAVELRFKHGTGATFWIIDLPAKFPDVAAMVYYLFHENSSQRNDVTLHGHYSCGPLALNTSKLIIKAICSHCCCTICYEAQKKYRQ